MNVFDAMAINGRWVRIRLTEEFGGRSLVGFVGAVVIGVPGSPVESHVCFEQRLSHFSPCGSGSEFFLSDIAEVEHVYKSAPRVVPLRVV